MLIYFSFVKKHKRPPLPRRACTRKGVGRKLTFCLGLGMDSRLRGNDDFLATAHLFSVPLLYEEQISDSLGAWAMCRRIV